MIVNAIDLRPGDVFLNNGRKLRVKWRQHPDRQCPRLARFYVRIRFVDIESDEHGEFPWGCYARFYRFEKGELRGLLH